MIELSGGSAFFAKLWSAKEGREGRARERKKSEKTFRQKRRKKKGKMLGGTITDNDSIDGKKKEEEEREEEVALVLGLCPKRRSKLPTREEYFFVRKKVSAPLFFAFSKVLWPFLLLLGIHILITLLLHFTCPYPKLASVMDLRLPAGGGAEKRSTKYTQKSPHRGPKKRRKTVIVSLLPPSPSPTLFPLPIFARVKLRMKNPKFPTLFFELYVVASPPSFSISRAAKKRRKGERTVGQFES